LRNAVVAREEVRTRLCATEREQEHDDPEDDVVPAGGRGVIDREGRDEQPDPDQRIKPAEPLFPVRPGCAVIAKMPTITPNRTSFQRGSWAPSEYPWGDDQPDTRDHVEAAQADDLVAPIRRRA
jgi:hypothetical protein